MGTCSVLHGCDGGTRCRGGDGDERRESSNAGSHVGVLDQQNVLGSGSRCSWLPCVDQYPRDRDQGNGPPERHQLRSKPTRDDQQQRARHPKYARVAHGKGVSARVRLGIRSIEPRIAELYAIKQIDSDSCTEHRPGSQPNRLRRYDFGQARHLRAERGCAGDVEPGNDGSIRNDM